jgi:hypothetical protein
MKKIQLYSILAIIAMTTLLSGCQLIGDIFKAGVWVGVLMVVVVVGLILFLLVRLFGGGK